MALGQLELLFPGQDAYNGQLRIALDGSAKLGLVTGSGNTVQDNARNVHLWIENAISEEQRSDASRHSLGINDQDNWRTDELGKRRVTIAAFQIDTIVEAHIGLNEREVRVCRLCGQHIANLGCGLGVEIKIVGGPPGGTGMPHRINVVWTLLEGLYLQPRIPQRALHLRSRSSCPTTCAQLQ